LVTATRPAPIAEADARRVALRVLTDPAWFVQQFLGLSLYDKQIAMLESVRDHPQTSVLGGNTLGKDFCTGGALVPWWLASHYMAGLPAKAIIMGPTARQVHEIVWRHTRQSHTEARAGLGGRMYPKDSKWEYTDDTFALGFATDKPENITGFHSPHLLVVVTEAHAVDDAQITMIKRLNPKRLILTGNPFSDSGEFFDSHGEKRHLYSTITITAHDSPNVTAGREVIPGLVTQADIDRYAADWGTDSPLYRATVNAEFVGAPDGLIKLEWIRAAADRSPLQTAVDSVVAGLDPAGPGEDETVLTLVCGGHIIAQLAWTTDDPRGDVVAALEPYRGRLLAVNVDSIGIGYGMALHLQDLGFPVQFVNVGEKSDHPETDSWGPGFANLRAQCSWAMRERFRAGDVSGLASKKAEAQLSGLRYQHNPRGQVQIEKKEDMKKRIGHSPDWADSLMLALIAPPVIASGGVDREPAGGQRIGRRLFNGR
jgi:hypothetical protein